MADYYIIFTFFVISIILSAWFMYFGKKVLVQKNMYVLDMNKLHKPRVLGLGGINFVLAFLVTINFLILAKLFFNIENIDLKILLPAILTISLIAFVGFVDDILMFPFRPIKPILVLLASMPMIAISYQDTSVIRIPLCTIEIGTGIFYGLLIVPLVIIFCSNVYNVMADFDGLSPGNGIIISITLFICSLVSRETTAAYIFIILLGILIIFYFYNKFPAKIFSGNVGTLFIGAVFAVGGIIANLKYALLIVMIPYIIHFILQERMILKYKNIFARPRERGMPQPDGTLKSEYNKSYGLTHFFMLHFKNMTEKKLVYYIMATELFFCVLAIIFHYHHLYI